MEGRLLVPDTTEDPCGPARPALWPDGARDRAPGLQADRQAYSGVVAIADETYVLFTTFKRDGTPVSTPVWWVQLGPGSFGFWTSSSSGKAQRLAHTEKVTVQPCNARGHVKPGTEPLPAVARLVMGEELQAIRVEVVAKYGFLTKLTKIAAKFGGWIQRKPFPYGDRGVIVTL